MAATDPNITTSTTSGTIMRSRLLGSNACRYPPRSWAAAWVATSGGSVLHATWVMGQPSLVPVPASIVASGRRSRSPADVSLLWTDGGPDGLDQSRRPLDRQGCQQTVRLLGE